MLYTQTVVSKVLISVSLEMPMTAIDVLDPDKRVLDHSRMGEILVDNALDRQNSPPILAPVIQNANPVVAAPDNEIVNGGA